MHSFPSIEPQAGNAVTSIHSSYLGFWKPQELGSFFWSALAAWLLQTEHQSWKGFTEFTSPLIVQWGCGCCSPELVDRASFPSSTGQDLSYMTFVKDLPPELGLDPSLQPPHLLPLVTTACRK